MQSMDKAASRAFIQFPHFQRIHWRIAEFVLFLMLIGPIIAPYFAQIANPLFQAVSQIIFAIGDFICPQPEQTFMYGGMPFMVCFRCGAGLFGLIIARWLHRPDGAMRHWSILARLIFLGANLLWLSIDVHLTHQGIWAANIPLMITHGVIYGMSVGGICFGLLVFVDQWLTDKPRVATAA